MTRILFVCHGNICRSVMAEMMMKHAVRQQGREAEFIIDSCATSTEELGNDIYPPAKCCLTAHNIPFTPHSARQITLADYDRYDHIICMERYNIRNLPKLSPKVQLLLPRDVADPWYSGDFETTYHDLEEGITSLL
ncbi:MAG: low molecular weight phosphotyrosine protein phosphatase [Paludibacteraceae bacterium]|nr:low molecular weight phosphotyrosine protein phosphatase [Paludibacteraceae bacterium]